MQQADFVPFFSSQICGKMWGQPSIVCGRYLHLEILSSSIIFFFFVNFPYFTHLCENEGCTQGGSCAGFCRQLLQLQLVFTQPANPQLLNIKATSFVETLQFYMFYCPSTIGQKEIRANLVDCIEQHSFRWRNDQQSFLGFSSKFNCIIRTSISAKHKKYQNSMLH